MPTAAEARAMFNANNLTDADAAQWVADAVEDINEQIIETASRYDHIRVWLQYNNDATLADVYEPENDNIIILSRDWKNIQENADYYMGLMDIVGELFEEDGYRVDHFVEEPNWVARFFGAQDTDCGRAHLIVWDAAIEVNIRW